MSSSYPWDKVEETGNRIFLNLRCCLDTDLLEHRALNRTTQLEQILSALYTLFASPRYIKADPHDG